MRLVSFGFILGLLLPAWTFAAPTVARIIPPPDSTIHSLLEIEVLFEDVVTNVDAGDLLINGVPATGIRFGIPGQFVFEFPQPATGTVQVAWAPNHGITDLGTPPEPFVGDGWSYDLNPNAATDALLLNEFMADNKNTLNDEDGDASDWIEISNPGVVQVDMGGWFLTDDSRKLNKWRFPAGATIPARGFMVVFASNKDRTNVVGRLHTNFQLSKGGEYLALVDPRTNVVSDFAPQFPPQETDVSYGRIPGATSLSGYFTKPTPGAANQTGGTGFAPEVTFSRQSGTFVQGQPFSLTLSAAVTGGQIYYAFGTNVPSTNSTRYSAPLTINATTMIRARAFAPGLLPGPVTTKTYIALANTTNVINFNSHLPIMVLHNYGQGTVPATKTEQYVIVQTFEPQLGKSSLTSEPSLAEFGIFHVRGSSTAFDSTANKSSFFLEVQDEFRNDKEVPMLGLPQESDWVLYAANNFDPVSIHNPLAFQLARDMGQYASRTRFMEVYLKDDTGSPGPVTAADYYGLFVLEEKIKRDNNRVNIAPLERENVTQPTVTGGYMWSVDRSATGEQTISFPGAPLGVATLNWVEPNGFEIANAARSPQRAYVTNYMVQFNNSLTNANWTNATGYAAYIDVDSWVTRHIHEVVTHNIDGLRLSGYLFKDRNKKIEYGPAWDYDRTQGSTDGRDFNPRVFRSRIPDLGTDYFNPQSSSVPWWGRLFLAPDFWQAWIDKYQAYREGPLALTNVAAHINELAAFVRPQYQRETNRWPTSPVRYARVGTISNDGFSYNFGSVREYDNEVRWTIFWYSNRLDFIDTNMLNRPSLSGPSGLITNGYAVTLSPASDPGTTLFYTLDGTDPRLSGGGILPTAFSNNGPVSLVISNGIRLFARSWNPSHSNLTGLNNPPISSPWSGSRQASFYTAIPALRITEIMYHPQDPAPNYTNDVNFEYLEVKNIGATPLNIKGFKISGGLDFTFGDVTLAAGQAGVIVANQAQFTNRYGSGKLILGQYAGDFFGEKTNVLDNAGDHLVLTGSVGEPILDFSYSDSWYPLTDGFGFSLVIVDENASPSTWGLKESWRQSGVVGGSPAAADPAPSVFPHVVVNEVLTHSETPPPYDSIELLNLSPSAADISGWFLTDEYAQPRKFRIPDGTVIPAGGYLVFDETQFNTGAGAFSLNSLGEEVYLFSGDPVTENITGYYHGFDFGAAEDGRSFGRYVTSTGGEQFPPQATTTLGGPNAGPLIGPVIISEIQYHPFDLAGKDNTSDEYIELHNITSTNVPLYDLNHPQNTWHLRNGIDYDFSPGVVMPPGGYLLVVNIDSTDPAQVAAFRTRNQVPAGVGIYGPYSGKLDNEGEAIELRRPDRPEPAGPPTFGTVPSLLVERVKYESTPPWPTNYVDGGGMTLNRIADNTYGNDATNWVSSGASAGAAYVPGPPPQITVQPANTSAYYTHDASFSVQATGASLRYQWLFNGQPISGATDTTLHLTYLQFSQAGNYSVIVLGSGGRVDSSAAVLTVLTNNAIIVSQPQDITAVLGTTVTNTVGIATSGPVTYQWFFNGAELPGANIANLVITNVALTNAGTYYLRISDASASIFTLPMTLTVTVPPFFVVLPQSQYVPTGATVTVSVVVTNNATLPITYRWRRIGGGGQTNTDVNSTSDFFTVANVTASNRYDVIVFNAARPNGLQMVPPFFVAPIPDADHDGIPDAWELQYGLDPNSALDANGDLDGDGMTNLAEYIAGTDPTDPNSYLFVDLVSAAGGPATAVMRFNAVSNRTYTVQYRDSLTSTQAIALQHVTSATTNRIIEVIDSSPNAASRFYRLVTPKQ